MVFKCFDLKRSTDGLWKQEEGGSEGGQDGYEVQCGCLQPLCWWSPSFFTFCPCVCVLAGVETHGHTDALSVAANWTDSRQLTLCR